MFHERKILDYIRIKSLRINRCNLLMHVYLRLIMSAEVMPWRGPQSSVKRFFSENIKRINAIFVER